MFFLAGGVLLAAHIVRGSSTRKRVLVYGEPFKSESRFIEGLEDSEFVDNFSDLMHRMHRQSSES